MKEWIRYVDEIWGSSRIYWISSFIVSSVRLEDTAIWYVEGTKRFSHNCTSPLLTSVAYEKRTWCWYVSVSYYIDGPSFSCIPSYELAVRDRNSWFCNDLEKESFELTGSECWGLHTVLEIAVIKDCLGLVYINIWSWRIPIVSLERATLEKDRVFTRNQLNSSSTLTDIADSRKIIVALVLDEWTIFKVASLVCLEDLSHWCFCNPTITSENSSFNLERTEGE